MRDVYLIVKMGRERKWGEGRGKNYAGLIDMSVGGYSREKELLCDRMISDMRSECLVE